MIKLTHIITDLATGGAEIMLYRLLTRIDRSIYEPEVISLTTDGPIGIQIAALGIPVRALGMSRSAQCPSTIWRLWQWLSQRKPDVVQTWLYHADLVGTLALGRCSTPLIWSLHNGFLSATDKLRTRLTARACALLSHRAPRYIVCCAQSALRAHVSLGYSEKKMIFIPNGFDLEQFHPDPNSRLSVRWELGIPLEAPLVGMIARFDRTKDYPNFIEAARKLNRYFPDAHFLCTGKDVTWENTLLATWIYNAGMKGRFHLLGLRDDMRRIAASLDVACCASICEASPLSLGEAMACGVPCVVTDVGDSARMVQETGRVVPPRDPHALAKGLMEILSLSPLSRSDLGQAARKRIELNFNLSAIVSRYQDIYERVGCQN